MNTVERIAGVIVIMILFFAIAVETNAFISVLITIFILVPVFLTIDNSIRKIKE